MGFYQPNLYKYTYVNFLIVRNYASLKWELAGQPSQERLHTLETGQVPVSGIWPGLDSLCCGSTVSAALQQVFLALAGSFSSTYWKMKHILTHRRQFSRQRPFKLVLGMKRMVKGDWLIARNSQTFGKHLSHPENTRKKLHISRPQLHRCKMSLVGSKPWILK